MPAEHYRPDGKLMQGYYCGRCGEGGVNMLATGHGEGKCEPAPTLVAALEHANRDVPKRTMSLSPEPPDYLVQPWRVVQNMTGLFFIETDTNTNVHQGIATVANRLVAEHICEAHNVYIATDRRR